MVKCEKLGVPGEIDCEVNGTGTLFFLAVSGSECFSSSHALTRWFRTTQLARAENNKPMR